MSGRMGPRLLLAAFAAAAVAAIVAGIVLIASPAEQRLLRLDMRRIEDLADLSRRIDSFRDEYERLPAALDELAKSPGVAVPSDPVTGAPYEYEPVDDRRFRLCATFDAPTPEEPPPYFGYGGEWPHDRGRHCFERRVDAAGNTFHLRWIPA